MFKPRLCEILNIEVDEEFKIKYKDELSYYDYWITNTGRLITNSPYGKSEYALYNYDDEAVVYLINGDYQVVKGCDYNS